MTASNYLAPRVSFPAAICPNALQGQRHDQDPAIILLGDDCMAMPLSLAKGELEAELEDSGQTLPFEEELLDRSFDASHSDIPKHKRQNWLFG